MLWKYADFRRTTHIAFRKKQNHNGFSFFLRKSELIALNPHNSSNRSNSTLNIVTTHNNRIFRNKIQILSMGLDIFNAHSQSAHMLAHTTVGIDSLDTEYIVRNIVSPSSYRTSFKPYRTKAFYSKLTTPREIIIIIMQTIKFYSKPNLIKSAFTTNNFYVPTAFLCRLTSEPRPLELFIIYWTHTYVAKTSVSSRQADRQKCVLGKAECIFCSALFHTKYDQ